MILALCELYNPLLHGGDNTYMKYKYLVALDFTPDEFYNNEHITETTLMKLAYQSHPHLTRVPNKEFPNYTKIIENPNYYKLHIVDDIELDTGEMIGVLKTHTIAILQRKWKKIYKERKNIINKRKNPKAIMYRQMNGKWPLYCSKYI